MERKRDAIAYLLRRLEAREAALTQLHEELDTAKHALQEANERASSTQLHALQREAAGAAETAELRGQLVAAELQLKEMQCRVSRVLYTKGGEASGSMCRQASAGLPGAVEWERCGWGLFQALASGTWES